MSWTVVLSYPGRPREVWRTSSYEHLCDAREYAVRKLDEGFRVQVREVTQ